MEDLNTTRVRQHKMVLTDRGICNITGVCDVLSFDVAEGLLETEQGMLMIKGSDLHVSRLTVEKGEVDVEGTVDSLAYSSNEAYRREGQSLFARLFK